MSDAAAPRPRPNSPFVLLLGAALLVLLRSPLLLLHGRVYAEEGTTYLRFAWDTTWAHALLATHQGYYALVPNVVALVAARVVPLTWVALLFPWSALVFQLLAVWLAIRCDAFAGHKTKLLAVLVVVLSPPSGEVWLNTINSQFYLAICTALILISKPRLSHLAILLLSGLTGVVSCFLLPFLWLRAYVERTRLALTQAILLSACTALQIVLVLRAGLRHVDHHLAYLIEACADKNVLFVFFTSLPAKYFANFASAHATAALLPAILLLVVLAVLLSRVMSYGGRPAVLLISMAIWGEACALFCGIDVGSLIVFPYANPRYFLFCNVCIGLAIVLAWSSSLPTTRMHLIVRCLLGATLLSGTVDYIRTRKMAAAGPDWPSQINLRGQTPNRPIRIAPADWSPLYLAPGHPDLNLPDDIYDSTKSMSGHR